MALSLYSKPSISVDVEPRDTEDQLNPCHRMHKERNIATMTTDVEGRFAWLVKHLSGPIDCTHVGSQDGVEERG